MKALHTAHEEVHVRKARVVLHAAREFEQIDPNTIPDVYGATGVDQQRVTETLTHFSEQMEFLIREISGIDRRLKELQRAVALQMKKIVCHQSPKQCLSLSGTMEECQIKLKIAEREKEHYGAVHLPMIKKIREMMHSVAAVTKAALQKISNETHQRQADKDKYLQEPPKNWRNRPLKQFKRISRRPLHSLPIPLKEGQLPSLGLPQWGVPFFVSALGANAKSVYVSGAIQF